MNLAKIKLIVVDMDGTLLNSKGVVSSRFFDQFHYLNNKNINFIIASGRQYQSIIDKIMPIKNEITIIAENGGLIKSKTGKLFINDIPAENVNKSINSLRKIKDSNIVLCGEKSAYIETNESTFINMLSKYYSRFKIVKDLTAVDNDKLLKIAAFHCECSETNIYPYVKHLDSEMSVIISGKNWLDISNLNTNKGYALKFIQNKIGVSIKETMAFGDYNNDLKMLNLAHFSYAMQNAHPNVKKAARFHTKNNNQQGVEIILQELIDVL